MDNLGFTQGCADAEEFDAFLKEEYQRYGDVIERAGLGNQ